VAALAAAGRIAINSIGLPSTGTAKRIETH